MGSLIPGKGTTNSLDNAMLTAENEHSVSFTEQQNKFYFKFTYNSVMNSYLLVNG